MQLQARVIVALVVVGAVAGTGFLRTSANGSLRPVDQVTLASVPVEKAKAPERTMSARKSSPTCQILRSEESSRQNADDR